MLKLPNTQHSFWKSNNTKPTYQPLHVDLEIDAVIVGGGITGLTCAYLLKQSGLKVMVLEKNTLASGTTGGTTGKVTSQHGLTYADLDRRIGSNATKIYGEANQEAIERIEKIIIKEKIDCGWERDNNYVYTTDPKQVQKFKTETKVAQKLGLPASFETTTDLPFHVEAAVKFADQAKIDAYKYVYGLAKAVHGNGSYVFENSNVTQFSDGNPAQVKTDLATVMTQNIIVATKMPAFPLLARFTCALQEYPHTSYLIAGVMDSPIKGMYISPDKGHYSILPVSMGKETMLLVGGRNHIPGLGNSYKRQQQLANYAENHFGIKKIAYRWKAMDYLAYDNVPLVGKIYPWSKHLYTATAYRKWGLSSSMVAGVILHDTILGKPNPWANTFSSTRLRPLVAMPRAIAKEILS
jgi:glycine/D-amino acid oxidase-like deaminating enzyme